MRRTAYLDAIWARGGPFIGLDKACAYVTVEDGWWLNTEQNPGRMQTNRRPVRWWQRADNSQVETEIPGIKTIRISRNLGSDAGELELTMANVLPQYNDEDPYPQIPGWGIPGGFTLNHGQDADGAARWGHEKNAWFRVLRPGCLIRTYQGFGGWVVDPDALDGVAPKTRAAAIAAGNVLITGVWLIDEVEPGSDGTLNIRGRDMAALLIDQSLYPPLVPRGCYPTRFWKYDYSTRNVPTTAPRTTVARRRLRYLDSAQDRWYGPNASIHGHSGTDSIDGRPDTFALSVGNSHPSRPFATDWWEYGVGAQINSVTVHPWGGNYDMYVSVMVGGRWQGTEVVPYDHTPLIGHQPTVVDTGADIPYVAKFRVPWEKAGTYQLPAMYQAERIRISFRNHTRSPWGPWFYRCGIREVYTAAAGEDPSPQWVDLVAHPGGFGYWAISNGGVIQSFGDAFATSNLSSGELKVAKSDVVAMETNIDGTGLLILTASGHLFRKTTNIPIAGMPGPLPAKDAVGLAMHRQGQGYWVVRRGGQTYAYGGAPVVGPFDATSHGPIVAVASTGPEGSAGLYALYRDGFVQCRGDAIHQGNGPAGVYTDITPMPGGSGYYLTTVDGTVHRVGTTTGIGAINDPDLRKMESASASAIIPALDDPVTGFATLTGDGYVAGRGEWPELGHPAGGEATVRRPGNYSDLTDIVKLILLWSGFHLKGGNTASQPPAVFGNLESSGFAPDEPLKEDMFDKRSPMDVINTLKEITGYVFFVDQEGAVHYESPNFWQSGNFDAQGRHTDFVFEIDESHNLTNFRAVQSKKSERSQIHVSDGEPLSDVPGVRTGRWNQPTWWREQFQDYLRGMVVPTGIGVPVTLSQNDMTRMAQLVAVQLFFKRRTSAGACVAHPGIDINDQVRIWEQNSSEQFLNYMTAVNTTQDIAAGTYTMDFNTYWLGAARHWAITSDENGVAQRRRSIDTLEITEETRRQLSTGRLFPSDDIDLAPPPPDLDDVPDPDDDRVGPA